MSRTTMYLTVIVLIIVLAVALVVIWHYFFGMMNPPLPATNVTIESSSATTTLSGASSSAFAAKPSSSAVQAPRGDQLSIDRMTWNVELATTATAQARGLSYRQSLGARDGMLFIFSSPGVQNFWMKDMNFPLDIIWIASDTVVGFVQDAPPPAPGAKLWQLPVYSSPDGVDKVLEVNAGLVANYGIQIGDKVLIAPPPAGTK